MGGGIVVGGPPAIPVPKPQDPEPQGGSPQDPQPTDNKATESPSPTSQTATSSSATSSSSSSSSSSAAATPQSYMIYTRAGTPISAFDAMCEQIDGGVGAKTADATFIDWQACCTFLTAAQAREIAVTYAAIVDAVVLDVPIRDPYARAIPEINDSEHFHSVIPDDYSCLHQKRALTFPSEAFVCTSDPSFGYTQPSTTRLSLPTSRRQGLHHLCSGLGLFTEPSRVSASWSFSAVVFSPK